MSQLTGVRACVFDAYGTVFDFASAAARCPDIPEERCAALTTMWRDKQLQYLAADLRCYEYGSGMEERITMIEVATTTLCSTGGGNCEILEQR